MRPMPIPTRRPRWLAVLAAVLLLFGACSSGDDESDVDASGSGSESSDQADDTADGADTGADGSSDDGDGGEGEGTDGSTSGASGGTGGGAPGGAPAAGGGAGGGEAAGGGQPSSPTAQPAAAGTYHYTVDGTAKQGTTEEDLPDATLKVSAPEGGRQRNVQTADDGSSRQELVLEYKDDAVYLHELSISQSGVNKVWKFSPAQVAFPNATAPGTKWGWTGTSTDGKTKLDATFEITGAERLTIGGQAVDTIAIHTVTTTSGDIQSTTDETWWVAPSHRLIVKSAGSTTGSFGPFTFSSQHTSVLDSLNPS